MKIFLILIFLAGIAVSGTLEEAWILETKETVEQDLLATLFCIGFVVTYG